MEKNDFSALRKKLDRKNCHRSIVFFPRQCLTAWEETKTIPLPKNYREISSLAFVGMGGSGFGGRIIKSLYREKLNFPVFLVNDYFLPPYLDKKALLFFTSYSGETEETLFVLQKALGHFPKILGITSGGTLAKIFTEKKLPLYLFSPQFNPSGQPRLGGGYLLFAQLGILSRLGKISLREKEVKEAISWVEERQTLLEERAKENALLLQNKIAVFLGGENLAGVFCLLRNCLHETGKHFADFFLLPEANHHLLEGLSFPKTQENLLFFTIFSSFYPEKIKRRLQLTQEVIKKNKILTLPINLSAPTKLGETLELIQWGSFLSFYLGLLHHVNPAEIPWVDYFKQKMLKKLSEGGNL